MPFSLGAFASGGGFQSLGGAATAFGVAAYTSSKQAKAAAKSRDFQEYMSNTAYQRQVEDMKLAGLNPILAASKGGGASTPPGAQAQVTAPDITTGLKSMQAKQELRNMKSLEKQSRSQAHKNQTAAVADLAIARAQNANAVTSAANAKLVDTQNASEQLRQVGLRNDAIFESSGYAQKYRHGGAIGKILGPAVTGLIGGAIGGRATRGRPGRRRGNAHQLKGTN